MSCSWTVSVSHTRHRARACHAPTLGAVLCVGPGVGPSREHTASTACVDSWTRSEGLRCLRKRSPGVCLLHLELSLPSIVSFAYPDPQSRPPGVPGVAAHWAGVLLPGHSWGWGWARAGPQCPLQPMMVGDSGHFLGSVFNLFTNFCCL